MEGYSQDTIQQREIHSVTEINQTASDFLNEAFPPVWVAGEISNFREGGKLFLKNLIKDEEGFFDNHFFSALSLMILYKKNYNISVFMPYSDRLNSLSFWYRQYGPKALEKIKWELHL